MQLLPLACLLAAPLAAPLAAQWHALPTAAAPAPRLGAAAAFDPASGQVVLFGGSSPVGPGLGTRFGDTWTYDGHGWRRIAVSPSPSPRTAALAADLARGVLVLYGGDSPNPFFGGPALDETWELRAGAWSRVQPAQTPGGRTQHALAYDAARHRVVLYGGLADTTSSGLGSPPPTLTSTWEYDGATWTQATPAHDPGPLADAAMCWHNAMQCIVLFGGQNAQGLPTTTWTYDGVDWRAVTLTSAAPPGRVLAGLVYDHARGTAILHGGYAPASFRLFGDTWEFAGTTWQRWPRDELPRQGAALAFDERRSASIQFGGQTDFGTTLGDTRSFGALLDVDYGAGCAGSNGVPTAAAPAGARIGAAFAATVDHLAATVPITLVVLGFAARPVPIDMTPLGMPGCTSYATVDYTAIVGATGGRAAFAFAVPPDTALANAEFFCRVFSYDAVNAFGGVSSNTMRGIIGS